MKMWNTSEIWRVFYANKTRLDRLKLTTLGYIMSKLDLKLHPVSKVGFVRNRICEKGLKKMARA